MESGEAVLRISVTGAEGFIGSHLCERLMEAGHDVRALVNYNSQGSIGWLEEVHHYGSSLEVVFGDLRDRATTDEICRNVDAVAHLAALISIPYSYSNPQSYVDVNVSGTLNLLESLRGSSSRLMHVSTSEVYGTAQTVPIDETHPINPQSPYAASKVGADQLVNSYVTSFEVNAVTIRPFNTYGPRQSTRAFIGSVMSQLSSGTRELKLGNLEPTRDFTYVTDTAHAMLLALESSNGIGEVFNLGSQFEISMRELLHKIRSVCNVEFEVDTSQALLRPPKSEVERLISNSSKARQKFGYSPEFDGEKGLERGLVETWEWFSRRKFDQIPSGFR